MAQWTEEQLQAWYQKHGPEKARRPLYKSEPVQTIDPITKLPTWENRSVQIGEELEAKDGAKIQLIRLPESGQPGSPDYDVFAHDDTTDTKEPPPRTPDQARSDAAQATTNELQAATAQRHEDEVRWNANPANIPDGASGIPEDHTEKSIRIAKEREQERLDQAEKDRQTQQARQTAADEERNRQAAASLAEQAREHDQSFGVSQGQLTLAQQREQREANKPDFLPADTRAPKITKYNPATGQIESLDNPNYDPIKAAAEEKRAELASQIAARQISLEEAKASYSQWFDTNVKTPMMMAQEQRARAEEQRAALDAEERRRQFAADFGLRKATLGQQAAATAIQAEESLLPYRAGPNEAADMSSAINGLAAGGIVGGPSAGAGVHFTADDFQFNAPNFKKIAADATKAVLSHLTDYRPSDQSYSTADYSGVPSVNLSGMPAMPSVGAYTYGPSSLPAPSPGADQPTG